MKILNVKDNIQFSMNWYRSTSVFVPAKQQIELQIELLFRKLS